MGGSAFSAGPDPLHTPRMPPNVYDTVKKRYHDALRELYLCVASPIDGPGKTDYGDVDILVAWDKKYIMGISTIPNTDSNPINSIRSVLGAERVILEKAGTSAHMAIPWPQELSNDETDAHQRTRYIQIDIRICDSLEELQWMLFKHAHGDIWNLLGTIIRPYGLTVNEVGLWLRIPEIEEINKNKSKILLTKEPCEILSFLGLEVGKLWEAPFPSLNDMYEYVTRCRMFWVRPARDEETTSAGSDTGFTEDKKKLKANDRRRMASRPAFSKWVDEYIPRCREERLFSEEQTTRGQVREEAFQRFLVKEEYEGRLKEFRLERQTDMVWRQVIKGSFPETEYKDPQYRGCLVKAMKKIIMENDGSYGVVPDLPMKGPDGFFVIENIYDFIARRGADVGKAAMDKHHSQYSEYKKKGGVSGKTGSEGL